MKRNTLLYCLLHVLLCRIELLLKELDLAGEGVVGGLAGFPFCQGSLVISQLTLCLFELGVENGKPVIE